MHLVEFRKLFNQANAHLSQQILFWYPLVIQKQKNLPEVVVVKMIQTKELVVNITTKIMNMMTIFRKIMRVKLVTKMIHIRMISTKIYGVNITKTRKKLIIMIDMKKIQVMVMTKKRICTDKIKK